MDEFSIKSEKEVTLTFHSRHFDPSGWLETYAISATAKHFQAVIRADNVPYGKSPAVFFQELATNWAGWKGEKSWAAFEGEYDLRASTDLTGHITLVAEFNPTAMPPCFSSKLSLIIEAGQLEQIARRAKVFFSQLA